MTRDAILPMESYRLAQYAIPIPCYICETENTFDSEYCQNCLAPMALAHQAASQKVQPEMMAVLGPSGVGKTVYLGMLMDMLSRMPDHLQVLARGAFSITLQQTTISALTRSTFPEKTPNEPDRWNWVHCQVRRLEQKYAAELIVPDIAGEALLAEVDHPHSYRVIGSYLKKCRGAMVLIDAARLGDGTRDQDYFTMKLISYLAELCDDPKDNWQRRPVALIFTKSDQCSDCIEDPTAYAKAHACGLWQHCQERFKVHRFFAASVAGSCAWRETRSEGRVRVPLRVEPYGITEPFEWLLGQLDKRKGGK